MDCGPSRFTSAYVFAVAGLLLSVFAVRETREYALLEAKLHHDVEAPARSPSFREVFVLTSWRDRRLFATCQAGLVNNLNDGMVWGVFPLFFAAAGLDLDEIALLAAVYPAVWGVSQLGTGALSDRIGRKWLIVGGMWVQALAIFLVILVEGLSAWLVAAFLLGLGTAMVYPTLLAAIGDVANPTWRASAVGVYRLWRDLGYAVGALLAGIVADLLGLRWAVGTIGLVTLGSGAVVAVVMTETRRPRSVESAGCPRRAPVNVRPAGQNRIRVASEVSAMTPEARRCRSWRR